MTTTHSDVFQFVQQASREDLDSLQNMIKARYATLRAHEVAINTTKLVSGASRVRITRIKPQYLDGLTGTFTHFVMIGRKQCAAIKLDNDSAVRYQRRTNRLESEISGIPVSCIEMIIN